MDTVKVSSKGQIVIPQAVREAQRIEAGTHLAIPHSCIVPIVRRAGDLC